MVRYCEVDVYLSIFIFSECIVGFCVVYISVYNCMWGLEMYLSFWDNIFWSDGRLVWFYYWLGIGCIWFGWGFFFLFLFKII